MHIEPGLPGIVGPHGCGESNLLATLRCAMAGAPPTPLPARRGVFLPFQDRVSEFSSLTQPETADLFVSSSRNRGGRHFAGKSL